MVRVLNPAVLSLSPHSDTVLAEDRHVRKLVFLAPGLSEDYRCGGLVAEINTYKNALDVFESELVTYEERDPEHRFLDDVLSDPRERDSIFVISWGPHIKALLKRLKGRHMVYHAHSAGYGFELPTNVPILAVSRNTMSEWATKSPQSLVYYLPNPIEEEFQDRQQDRPIDVLVQKRKSSRYLLEELVPELRKHCQVYVAEGYVEDLPGLFNQAKVFLYDSSEFWMLRGLTEGFGLPPMEAMACGCHVFSSMNGGLSDYMDPGFNAAKIAGHSVGFDVRRILAAVRSGQPARPPEEILREHRPEALRQRMNVIFREINLFFDEYARERDALHPVGRQARWAFQLRRLASIAKRAIRTLRPAWA